MMALLRVRGTLCDALRSRGLSNLARGLATERVRSDPQEEALSAFGQVHHVKRGQLSESEKDLLGVIASRLSARRGGPMSDARPQDPTFDWRTMFKKGDVVRDPRGKSIGVVLGVVDCSGDDTPRWELHVDHVVRGEHQGVGVCDPWTVVVTNDDESIAEALRLGLRWPVGHPNSESTS